MLESPGEDLLLLMPSTSAGSRNVLVEPESLPVYVLRENLGALGVPAAEPACAWSLVMTV